MVRILDKIDLGRFSQRTWVYTSGDSMSMEKADAYEKKADWKSDYHLIEVPRARKVGEGLLSTLKSSFISALSCVRMLLHSKPDLVSSPHC